MKQNAMRKNLRQSILRSFGRYIALAAIIMLGAGLFMGLLMSKSDMVATGQHFVEQQNMFDLRMVSNYGWSEEYVDKFAAMEGIADAEGTVYLDLIARTGEAEEDAVYRFYAIPQKINLLALRGGRLPQSPEECLVNGFDADDSVLGKKVVLSETNDEDSLDSIRYKTFTIVGYVASPLYMDMNRGTTAVGSGALQDIYFIDESAFDVDYFTEIYLTLSQKHPIYSDAYGDHLDTIVDKIEPKAEMLSQQRFLDVKAEAEEEYDEGYQEYLDGLAEFEEGKLEAETELADALKELQDAEQELKDNRQKLIDAENEIKEGREQIEVTRAEIAKARQELSAQKTALQPHYDAAIANIDAAKAGVSQLESAIGGLKAQISANNTTIAALNQQLADGTSADPAADQAAIAQLEGANAAIQGQIDTLQPQYDSASQQLASLNEVIAGMEQINAGKAKIDAGEQQMWQGEIALDNAYSKLMINWGLWHDGEEELADGWAEYEEAKLEVEQEIADAEAELKDAEEELRDAREEIDSMDKPDLILLDRNSNVGYNNLDSSSNIVAGVSRVLPVFFLLVASLVCITTMTRMIDEERTQIGTLKALGYTNSEIMRKYLIYSGSGAVLGCGMGIVLGCTIFPMIIWEAYKIMLYIQPGMVLTVNWPLAVAIVGVYTALMLLVTWHSCRTTLKEEPAELIRPKAPDPGKKILLEYLPFWHKISFLNKVTIRNIFRYRQRLAMMLVGIGGCTALLLTGFGLRDSIVNVVDYQFREVTHYDLSVYFREEITPKDAKDFDKVIRDTAEDSMFYHQSSVELAYNDRVKELFLISGDEKLAEFIDLHTGETKLPLPGEGEAVLSVGVCENMGISQGDSIVLRSGDLQELAVTVSGIYDNHIENYAIVAPETIEKQWGEAPELQMAFVQVREDQSVHAVSANITDRDYVMNVSVSDDLANMVRNMMDALDLVVMLIVVCAGLLAVIVLYNLTNININERIREIATIKVLGFNASETGAYVFKENMVLTVAGSLLGLILGWLLLLFVMSQVKIDMVWFKAIIEPDSYVWSIALTLLSALIVDFVFYFKLDKINMAEALKSVE